MNIVRIFPTPESSSLMIVVNDEHTINHVMDLLNGNPDVEMIDAIPSPGADYIAPSNVSETNDTPHHEIFKYGIRVKNGVNVAEFANRLASHLQKQPGQMEYEVIVGG